MKRLLGPALLWGCLTGAAVQTDGGVARIKAVYLYHFASFAEWPEAALVGQEVRLCVLGGGEVAQHVQRLDAQDLGDGRMLRVVPARPCHIVFVGDAAANFGEWQGLPVLSVSDRSDFARHGGMIEMYLRDDKVRMRINLAVVRAAGLRLSSKLLRLADIVEAP